MYALGRMHQLGFLQICLQERKFHIFKWKKCSLSRYVSHCLELHRKRQKKFWTNEKKCHFTKKRIFQYVYTKCYPEIFVQVEKCGINLRNKLLINFKAWKDKKQKIKINQQQPTAESNKDEIYSMRKPCENTASDDEFIEKKRKK